MIALAAFAIHMLTAPAVGSLEAQEAPAILVSTEWLAERLGDDQLVILHVGNEQSFTGGHIPGARHFPIQEFAPEIDGMSTELPDAETFRELLVAAGVSSDSRIVVYSATHPPQLAARLYLTLEHFGLGAQSSILDGGLRSWELEGRPFSTETAAVARGSLPALSARDDVIVDHRYVHARMSDGTATILDARDPQFWTGEQQNQQRAARAGRIPGALNIPFRSLVEDSGRLLDTGALAALFADAGVQPGQPVVTYCHVGQQASLVAIAARVLGYDVRMYDGSYEDWSARPELPVAPE
jgi:thiosulfate/3-mercaptopyruvate sulfurtransferase